MGSVPPPAARGRRLPHRLRCALAGALVLGCGGPPGTPVVDLDPLPVTRRAPAALAPVAFLSGCWVGRSASGSTVIEELWGPPSDGLMLGTTRFLRAGEVVGFEFGHIEATEDGIVYTPYPGGERSEHAFRLTDSSAGRVTFEAPEHDYPRRIRYRIVTESRIEVRIDAGPDDVEPRVWTLAGHACEGFPAK